MQVSVLAVNPHTEEASLLWKPAARGLSQGGNAAEDTGGSLPQDRTCVHSTGQVLGQAAATAVASVV